jgi:hypothetical protein
MPHSNASPAGEELALHLCSTGRLETDLAESIVKWGLATFTLLD